MRGRRDDDGRSRPPHPRRTWPQRLLIGVNTLTVVAALGAALALGYANDKLEEVQRIDLGLDVVDPEPTDPGEPQNYLLVGTDSAERLDEGDPAARESQGLLSDTIMVLRVDPDETQAQLLSFPRDLWVEIPGWGSQKINAALSGGRETLIATIQESFGIPVHHYVEVDFLGFQQLVDAVDGIPIWFDRPMRDENTGFYVGRPGCATLDADQALAYARSRHLEYEEEGAWQTDGTGDLGRVSRQQDFIRRAIARAIDKGVRNPITLNALVNAGISSVSIDTGLSVDDLLDLGQRFRSFEPEELQTLSLDTSFGWAGDISILLLDDSQDNENRLNIFRGLSEPNVAAGVADAASVSVLALNGTGTAGQATDVTSGLAALGFDTSPGSGDAETFAQPTTLVRYVNGNEATARFVASQLVAGATLEAVADTGGADVVVVTGADYAGVQSALVPPPTTAPAPSTTVAPAPSTTLPPLPTTTVAGVVPPPTPEGEDCG